MFLSGVQGVIDVPGGSLPAELIQADRILPPSGARTGAAPTLGAICHRLPRAHAGPPLGSGPEPRRLVGKQTEMYESSRVTRSGCSRVTVTCSPIPAGTLLAPRESPPPCFPVHTCRTPPDTAPTGLLNGNRSTQERERALRTSRRLSLHRSITLGLCGRSENSVHQRNRGGGDRAAPSTEFQINASPFEGTGGSHI